MPLLPADPKYPQDVRDAIQDKEKNPQKYKDYALGGHKMQKNMQSLSNPYQKEIEAWDEVVRVIEKLDKRVP